MAKNTARCAAAKITVTLVGVAPVCSHGHTYSLF